MMYTKLNNLKSRGLEAFAFSQWSGIICLVVLLCLGSTAKAEEYNLYIAGTQVTSDNANDVLGNGKVSYDVSTNILTISGDIRTYDENTPCIKSYIDYLTIKVDVDATTLLEAKKEVIFLDSKKTTITSSAPLFVVSEDSNEEAIIQKNGTLVVYDANISVNSMLYFHMGNMSVTNATLWVTGMFWGFGGNLDITNSNVFVGTNGSGGITSAGGTLSIDNSNVLVYSKDDTNGAIWWCEDLKLTGCYLATPQGGNFDKNDKMLKDSEGNAAQMVEIISDFTVDGLHYNVMSPTTVEVIAPKEGKYSGAITIPATVKNGENTFQVTAIGDNAFQKATDVTSVKLPLKNLTSIGAYAFNDCTGLTEFTLPECITSIGEKAFYYCDKLQHLYVHSSDPASYHAGSMAFSSINRAGNVCTLHVPSGTTQAYKDHERFNVFTQVEEFNNYNIFIAGTLVTSLNAADVLGDGAASYDASKNTLTISGDITASDAATSCIYTKINDLTIQIAAPSKLKATDNAIFIECKDYVEGKRTTITGSSKLTVSVSSDNDVAAIFQKNGNIVITDANLSLNGNLFYHLSHMTINNTNISIDGNIMGWGHLNVYNSTMSVEGQEGIDCLGGTFTIDNSTVTAHHASSGSVIYGWGDLVLKNCYLSNPQGGSYDTKSFELKDADGNKVQTMEIVPGVDPGLYIAGKYVSSKNASDILGDDAASYDESTKTLTIKGNISAPDENTPCIKSGVDGLTIQVAAQATLSATNNAIYLQGKHTTITGSPKLTVSVPSEDGSTTAIYQENGTLAITKADLSIIGKTLCPDGDLSIVKSKVSAAGDISGSGALLIEKSTVSATASDPSEPVIAGWESLTLNTCTIMTPKGGRYNTNNLMVVDTNDNYAPTVEIQVELIKGDANGDGDVDKDDIAAIVNYITTGKREGFYFNNADLNGDTKVDAADLVLLINRLK